MKVINFEDRLEQEQIAYVEKIINFAQEMILSFVKAKYGEKIDIEQINDVLDNTEFIIGHDKEFGTAATYHENTGKIDFNKDEFFNGNVIKCIGTVMHELQHKFSAEISQGEKFFILDEGFSDVFSEECINYFLQNHPEKFKEMGIEYIPKKYITESDYNSENEFIKMILEVIRQKSGRHYEAEYEYIFGEKERFLDIVRETLGEEVIEIIREQQKEPHDNLGDKYNYTYNEKLEKLIEKIQLQYVDINSENKREDGTINVYLFRQEKISEIARLQYVKSCLQNCIKKEDVEALIEVIGFDKISNQSFRIRIQNEFIKNLVDSDILVTEDILSIINNNFYPIEWDLEDEQMKKLMSGINGIDIKNYSEEEINDTLNIVLRCNKSNQDVLEFLQKLQDTHKTVIDESDVIQKKIKLAQMSASIEPKGEIIADILRDFSDNPVGSDEQQNIIAWCISDKISTYLQEGAKFDVTGINRLIHELKVMGDRIEKNDNLAQRYIYDNAKTELHNLLYKDMAYLSGSKRLLPDLEYGCNINENNVLDFFDKDLNELFLGEPTLLELIQINENTKLINLCTEEVIHQKIKDRICKKTKEEYHMLSKEHRKTYLTVLTDILGNNPSDVGSVEDIIELYNNIMRG